MPISDSVLPLDESPNRPDPTLPGGVGLFFLALGVLALVRIALGYIALPLDDLPVTNLVIAILFLSVPIVALYFAANSFWHWKTATAFVVGGLIVQFGIIGILMSLRLSGQVAGVLVAIAQGALGCWCVGLGALLATLIKEKNIILPIAIFLAAYDFFLVVTPLGYGDKFAKFAEPVLSKVASQIPSVSAMPTHGLARPSAYVGMADLVFLGMFFIALFRFKMRTHQTLFAVVPALLIYLFVVMFLGNQEFLGIPLSKLPAMVPIGLAVLLVNWKEFQLKKDEKIATVGLAVLAVAFLTFAATRSKPLVEPSQKVSGQAPQKPAG